MSEINEAEMAEKIGISVDELREWNQDILESFMYPIVLRMLKNNLIDLGKTQDRIYLWGVVKENVREMAYGVEIFTVLHQDFIDVAEYCIENGKEHTAIILIATSIEHIMNMFYRNLLPYKGVSETQITDIVKKSNLDAKLGWLMNVTSNASLPDNLLAQIREVSELRNAIVHYKAIPDKLDIEFGSWENIKDRIDKMDYDDLVGLPYELEHALMEILEQIDPMRKIASEIWHTLFDK